MLRAFLVPVIAVFVFAEGDAARWWAFAIFVFAALTDSIDGWVARKLIGVTRWGQLADPIADKALTGAAFIGLSLLDELAWWITALVIVREIGVTMPRFVVIRHGIIPASRGGKLKTVLQGIAIALYVLPFTGALATARTVVMVAAVAVTVVTGADYVARAMKLRRTSPRAEMKRRRRAHYDRTG